MTKEHINKKRKYEKKFNKEKELLNTRNMQKHKKNIFKWKHLNSYEKKQIIDIIKNQLKSEIFN